MAWRIDSTDIPTVSVQDTTVNLCFNNLLTVKVTKSQAWALQDAIRNVLSPSAANHKCPTCGGLGAPTHSCPKTGLSCSCCFKCTERCLLARDLDESAEESREECKAWDACVGDGLPEGDFERSQKDYNSKVDASIERRLAVRGLIGRLDWLDPSDARDLEEELVKFVASREKL